MKILKALILSLLIASSYNLSNASDDYSSSYSDDILLGDNEILEYIEQEGQTVRSTVEHFPGITRETVVGIYRNSSELVDAICNIAKTKTVHDNPNDKSMGFLGTIQYHLIQSGCAYPDDAVKAVIRKLYY